MFHIIKQCIRGMGTLPHVGDHPGTVYVLFFIFITGIAGSHNFQTAFGFLVGIVLGTIVFGPMYLIGAYSRAQISDRIEKNKND